VTGNRKGTNYSGNAAIVTMPMAGLVKAANLSSMKN